MLSLKGFDGCNCYGSVEEQFNRKDNKEAQSIHQVSRRYREAVEIYWTPIYMFSAIRFSRFSISLSADPSLHLLNTLFSLTTFNPCDFRTLLASNHLVCSLFFLILHAFLAFRSRFWGFLKNFGVFQNCWVLLKFWDVFLSKWSLNLIHCIT